MQDVCAGFAGGLAFQAKLLAEIGQVRSIEFAPRPGSPLHLPAAPEATCRIPPDAEIAPQVILRHGWHAPTLQLATALLERHAGPLVLVDVGANSGLFSRQLLARLPGAARLFAYEPHPGNFACLRHNLAPFPGVEAVNVALADWAGALAFHIDPDNAGNCSLNVAAMPAGRACGRIEVAVRAAAEEAARWQALGLPAFYKSDTQGHDEVIAAAIPPAFWDQAIGAVFELWRIAKSVPAGDFAAVLRRFPHRCFADAPGQEVTPEEVLAFLDGTDGTFRDLVVWR